MKLVFTPEAENSLLEIAEWVEEQNAPGSGSRFIDRFIDKIQSYALPNVTYSICRNLNLALFNLRCVTIDKWVVAFVVSNNQFLVSHILWGPGLK